MLCEITHDDLQVSSITFADLDDADVPIPTKFYTALLFAFLSTRQSSNRGDDATKICLVIPFAKALTDLMLDNNLIYNKSTGFRKQHPAEGSDFHIRFEADGGVCAGDEAKSRIFPRSL